MCVGSHPLGGQCSGSRSRLGIERPLLPGGWGEEDRVLLETWRAAASPPAPRAYDPPTHPPPPHEHSGLLAFCFSL